MKNMEPKDIEQLMRQQGAGRLVWFAGIGGCGMSGLAHLLLDLGFKVAGSDLEESEFSRGLKERGVEISIGHSAEALRRAHPFLVVYSPALRRENPELQEALRGQVPIVCRSFLLAALARSQGTVCIAGMHGKTTVSSILSFALDQLDPLAGYAVGGVVRQLPVHARFSEAAVDAFFEKKQESLPHFAIEADESDGALNVFDPQDAIILNIDDDHLDYFSSIENICRQFSEFSARVRGTIIYSADDSHLVSILGDQKQAVSCGFNPLAQYRIDAGETGGRFELWKGRERLGIFRTNLPGEKNIVNTAMAATWLIEKGFSPEKVSLVLRQFDGVKRRQERIYDDGSVAVFDDYAHHPAEILATIRAYRERQPKRLITVFQPHRFTRTQHLMEAFGNCFKQTDQLWLTDIYAAGEDEIEGVSGRALAAAVEKSGQDVVYHSPPAALRKALEIEIQPGDLILFLGAGNLTNEAHILGAELEKAHLNKMRELENQLAEFVSSETRLVSNEPMARRTTLRVGGPADLFIEPTTEDELQFVLKSCSEFEVPFFILGRGSNLLVKDGGFRGVVIHLKRGVFEKVKVDGNRVECGAGARLQLVAARTREAGVEGFEFLEGIPGSVGGALRMNAGAMGAATFDHLHSLRVMTYEGEIRELSRSDIQVQYRSCPMLKTAIALSAIFGGSPADSGDIADRLKSYSEKRKASQPRESSAGCMFKNPASIPAGKLVDDLGLKGVQLGAAKVSDVHGNFIVNMGGASASDVLNLMQYIRDMAEERASVKLESEVQQLGVEHQLSIHKESFKDTEQEVAR